MDAFCEIPFHEFLSSAAFNPDWHVQGKLCFIIPYQGPWEQWKTDGGKFEAFNPEGGA